MNFIDGDKFGKYQFKNWNITEQKGGDKNGEIQPFHGGGGFPLCEFNILKNSDEKHVSRFKDLVVPMGLVLEHNVNELMTGRR
jgi:hypothetical protein